MNRRRSLIAGIVLIVGLAAGAGLVPALSYRAPIRVGILHSLTGTMAVSERAVVDAALLAVEEINAAGGILGQQLEPLVVDGRSDWDVFAAEAERLIAQEGVSVVFGCWTSACRRTVISVFERYDHLLIYPGQGEGLEQSPNVIYTGSAPNQQLIPAVTWTLRNLGSRIFLVGSDDIFSRAAHAIIRDHAAALRGEVVGEAYIPLGETDMTGAIALIAAAQPDAVLNTLSGGSGIALFAALREAGIGAPVLSFGIAENELAAMPIEDAAGIYAAWTYFQSLDTPENRAFTARFRACCGADRAVSSPMEAAYLGVKLWAQAAADAETVSPAVIRTAILNRSLAAPQGVVYIDSSRYTWKTVRIGRFGADGQVDIVWDSGAPIRPLPFPESRTREQWNAFIRTLYNRWGGWANSGEGG
jgi:urea transport system substrate-binding protein